MSQFKEGDPAVTLVSLTILPAGSVVELYRAIKPGDNVCTESNPIYATVPGWWCAHAEVGDRLPFAESSLMPLRGDFTPEREKSSEVPA